MNTNRKRLGVLLVVIAVGLMVAPALAARQYRPALVGPTRWVSVSEPAYDGRDQSTQPVTTVVQKNDIANMIEGTGEFIGETVEGTGEIAGGVVDKSAEVVGEAGGGILTWVGDVAGAAGELVGGTWEFLFGGWGCPKAS